MSSKLPLIIVLLISGFGVSAHAQSKFAGRYDALGGYSSGQSAGLFFYGTATFARNGRASYTVYYPYFGQSGQGSGVISSKGVFSFRNGVRGNAQLVGKGVALGSYSDSEGNGFFALKKK
jgi:hypothetical protein